MQRQSVTAEAMANQLATEKNSKLYKAQSDEHKAEMLSKDIESRMILLNSISKRGKVNLSNVEEVKAQTYEYMEACRMSSTFPTLAGLSSAFGISRQRLYAYMKQHNNETTDFLECVRTIFADILTNQALYKSADSILTIFLLKNSGQGYTDKVEIEATNTARDLHSKEDLIREAQELQEIEEGTRTFEALLN